MRITKSSVRAASGALGICLMLLAGTSGAADGRWYTGEQVEEGRPLYFDNCAVCHGDAGEGQPGWQEMDSMGFYPAPPLDDSGHADEHPLRDMMNTLALGGGPLGGTMPSFSDVLSPAQMEAVIAYVQSLWPDDIYAGWVLVDSGQVPVGRDDHAHH